MQSIFAVFPPPSSPFSLRYPPPLFFTLAAPTTSETWKLESTRALDKMNEEGGKLPTCGSVHKFPRFRSARPWADGTVTSRCNSSSPCWPGKTFWEGASRPFLHLVQTRREFISLPLSPRCYIIFPQLRASCQPPGAISSWDWRGRAEAAKPRTRLKSFARVTLVICRRIYWGSMKQLGSIRCNFARRVSPHARENGRPVTCGKKNANLPFRYIYCWKLSSSNNTIANFYIIFKRIKCLRCAYVLSIKLKRKMERDTNSLKASSTCYFLLIFTSCCRWSAVIPINQRACSIEK